MRSYDGYLIQYNRYRIKVYNFINLSTFSGINLLFYQLSYYYANQKLYRNVHIGNFVIAVL